MQRIANLHAVSSSFYSSSKELYGPGNMYRALLKLGLVFALLISSAVAECRTPAAFAGRLAATPKADTFTDLGVWFSEHHQYACAVNAYNSGLHLQPDSPKLNLLLGLAFLAQGNASSAINPLQASIRVDPSALRAHLVLADALEQVQRKDEARTEWTAALKLDPQSTIALDGLSKNLTERGDYDSVVQLLGTDPHDQTLILDLAQAYQDSGRSDLSEQLLRKAIQTKPASEELSRALVFLLIKQRNFEESAKLAKKSVALHPGALGPQRVYLYVLGVSDDMALAKPLAAKLLKAAPQDFEVLYLNGIIEREEGDDPHAKIHLEEAVSIKPTDYSSHYNLGLVLNELGDTKGASEQFEKALALGATEPRVRFEYAKTLRILGESTLAEEQLKLYQQQEQALENSTLAASKAAQAENEFAAGNTNRAIVLFREAVTALPQNATLHLKLALALDHAGDSAGETDELQKALALNPHMAVAHDQLGYLASQEGDNTTAEQQFRAAIADVPRYAKAWIGLATTLATEGHIPEAQNAVENALQIDPDNKDAQGLRKQLAIVAEQAKH